MSWIDDLSLSDVWGGIKDGVKSASELYKDYSSSQLDLYKFNANNAVQIAQINAAQNNATANAQLQALQSQYALKLAQGQITNASLYANNGLDQQFANMNTILGRGTASNNLMMWLTIAGIGIAVMQYLKK